MNDEPLGENEDVFVCDHLQKLGFEPEDIKTIVAHILLTRTMVSKRELREAAQELGYWVDGDTPLIES